jgi:glycosyltransferase involved in cell wall biosynthesis
MRTVAGSSARVLPVFPGRVFAALESLAFPLPPIGGFQIFHGTSYSVPRFAGVRTIGTFYDIAFRHFPDAYPPGVAEGFDRSVKRALKYIDCVVTLSNHAKQEIVAAYGVDEQRVQVIYPAAVTPNGASGPNGLIGGSTRPFMLFVGEIGPRKNVMNLVRAFARVASAIPHRLILSGPEGPVNWYVESVQSEIGSLGLAGRVHLTGWLPDHELESLYRATDAVLLPSLYEGFGYPLIDAMAHGKPIVTSNAASMPEVAGDAALLVNPLKVDEIAEAMMALARDDAVRRRLAEAGRRRAGHFTTDAMVASLCRLYSALGDRPN